MDAFLGVNLNQPPPLLAYDLEYRPIGLCIALVIRGLELSRERVMINSMIRR